MGRVIYDANPRPPFQFPLLLSLSLSLSDGIGIQLKNFAFRFELLTFAGQHNWVIPLMGFFNYLATYLFVVISLLSLLLLLLLHCWCPSARRRLLLHSTHQAQTLQNQLTCNVGAAATAAAMAATALHPSVATHGKRVGAREGVTAGAGGGRGELLSAAAS